MSTASLTLPDFLLARIDEDEAIARKAALVPEALGGIQYPDTPSYLGHWVVTGGPIILDRTDPETVKLDEIFGPLVDKPHNPFRLLDIGPWSDEDSRADVPALVGVHVARHIAGWCPKRARAECAAKRAIIERETSVRTLSKEAMSAEITYAPLGEFTVRTGQGSRYAGAQAEEWLEQESTQVSDTETLRLLAQVYADHLDFNPAWQL